MVEWMDRGSSVICLSMGGDVLGAFAFADQLKPSAKDVVTHLQGVGMRLFLVTGDHESTAKAIARQCGIPEDRVFASTRPEGKVGLIQQLQSRGERVAFVGDGINDAPALQQSNLGIAVTRASDIARESADILLLRSDISVLPEVLQLARATLRVVRQNLFWAFFYNAAAVPLAALGFLNPLICAATMGLSDLMVVGNSLRLGKGRRGRRI